MPQPTDPTTPVPVFVDPPAPAPPIVRQQKNFIRRHWGKGLAALVVIGLGAVFGVRSALGPIVPVITPVRRELVQKVVASGRVRGPSQIDLGSVMMGKAVQVSVEEGQHVKTGELLIQLASAEAEAQVAQARATLAQAQARFALLRRVSSSTASESLRQASLAADSAEKELERSRTLAASGAISTNDLDHAQQARDLAVSQRANASTLAISSAAGGSDYAVALATVNQAQAALRASESRLADTRIVAPADGVVLERIVEPGSVVQPGAPLLVLAKDGATQLEVEPDEKSLAFVSKGQPALASADAFPTRIFTAQVTTIAPSIDRKRGTVKVKLSVADPPPNLLPDMTISVSIEVDRRANALVVPAEAVRDLSSPTPWVFVVRGSRAERHDVQIGITGEGMVEILGGVNEGEPIIPISAGLIKAGARVRTKPTEAK
jgi:HlyD family secretion protein